MIGENRLCSVPFHPVIYNPDLGDLSLLLAPPYDVIDRVQCERLLSRHPYNVVRLILPPSLDADEPSRYEKASLLWKQWLKERVLIESEEPSVFVYAQRFSLWGKQKQHLALLTTIPLTDYETGLVRPHEHTMPKPKSDRMNLMRAVGAELGQVHGLISDETGEWNELLNSIVSEPAWLKGELDGVEHIVWKVTDKAFNEEIDRLLSSQWLVIADGHHRYETALAFRDEIADAKVNPNHPSNFVGIVLADYQRNATILPTHRLLRFSNPEDVERVIQGIRQRFHSFETGWDGTDKGLADILTNLQGVSFLVVAQERVLLVTLSGVESAISRYIEQLPPPLRRVDTAVLHQAFLPFVLASVGIKPENLTIDYTHDATAALRFARVEGNMGILLRPIPLELVREVAAKGYRFPPKTTYFLPKVPSGLVMRKILP